MQQFFKDPRTIEHLHQGPLSDHLNSYAALLRQCSYSQASAQRQLLLVSRFSQWLQRNGIELRKVNEDVLQRFLRLRPHKTRIRGGDVAALNRLLTLLRQRRVVPPKSHSARLRPRQKVTAEFGRYLLEERRLSQATWVNYLPFVERFLTERFENAKVNLSGLRAADITGFVQRHARQLSPKRAKLLVTALRSFFRHLQHRGKISTDLAACVPGVPNWSFSALPKFLPAGAVQRVLKHCDRHTLVGKRNYAILLLLARLGLRAGEVVSLKLEDLDWGAGQITVCGKGGGSTPLPLPADVGRALATYLRDGRPRCSSRRVFLRDRAPLTGFTSSPAISTLVMRALKKAGVNSAHKGAHVFRHTLATDLLRQGCSLDEIGELLRHRSPNTTAIYAKVALSRLAKPGITVAGRWSMNKLRNAIHDYLELRRGLGFKLEKHEVALQEFAAFLAGKHRARITTALALEWATRHAHHKPYTWAARLSMVRGFARYWSATDPQTEIPPLSSLPYRPLRAQPYLYSKEEIRRLLRAAKSLAPHHPLRRWTYNCFFGLLAVTGLRLSEAQNLRIKDTDLSEGILTVRDTKFGKSRLVPLHPSTRKILVAYSKRRDRLFTARAEAHFFVNQNGNRLDKGDVHRTFYALSRRIGLRAPSASHGPRLHDFRHRFAVETLLRWYRNGGDPKRRLPILSTYLGHAHVTDTYWYLTGTPELLGAAGKRLEKRWEGLNARQR